VRRAIVTAALTGALALTGCGYGSTPQTMQVFDAGTGVNDRSGEVYVLNALVVDNGGGSGTLSVSLLDKSGDGDQLTAVDAATSEGEPIEVQFTVDPLELCAEQLAVVGSNAEVTLSGDNFTAGDTVQLAFTFRDAEPVRTHVPVVPRSTHTEGIGDQYASVAPSPGEATGTPQDCDPPTPVSS